MYAYKLWARGAWLNNFIYCITLILTSTWDLGSIANPISRRHRIFIRPRGSQDLPWSLEEFCLDYIYSHTQQPTKNLTPLISASKTKKFLQNFSHAHIRFLKFSACYGFSVYEPQGFFFFLSFSYFIHI